MPRSIHGKEVVRDAEVITAVGFVGGVVTYALAALGAFLFRREADLIKIASHGMFLSGFGALMWYLYPLLGIAG
jgi:hypothetical protein